MESASNIRDIESGLNPATENTPLLEGEAETRRTIPGEYQSSDSESSLLDGPTLPIAEDRGTGFLIGDYNRNTTRAQEILNASSKKRYIWSRFKPRLKKSAIQITSSAGKIVSTQGLAQAIIPNSTSETADMIKMNTIQKGVEGIFEPVESLAEVWSQPPTGDEMSALIMRDAMKTLRKEVEPLLEPLSSKSKDGIQLHITKFCEALEHFEPEQPYNLDAEDSKNRWNKIIRLISLPLNRKNVYQHNIGGNEAVALSLDEGQRNVCSGYTESTGEEINSVINSHRQNSINPNPDQPFHLFIGPPAVGKTYAARQITKATGATLIEASEDDLCEFLDVPVEGKKRELKWDQEAYKWVYSTGKIWNQLIEHANDSNIILLLDELSFKNNPKLLPAFKRWVTGEDPIFPGSRNVAGCPKFSVIAGSNEDIYAQLSDPASKSRIKTHVKFPDWPRDLLATRAREHFDATIKNMKKTYKKESLRKTSKDGLILLDHMLNEEKKYALGNINLRDIQNETTTFIQDLQVKNDTKQPYSLDDIKKKISEKLLLKVEDFLETRKNADNEKESQKDHTNLSQGSDKQKESEERFKKNLAKAARELGVNLREKNPEIADAWDKFRALPIRHQQIAMDSLKIGKPNKDGEFLEFFREKQPALLGAHCILNNLPTPTPTPPSTPESSPKKTNETTSPSRRLSR